MGGLVRVWAGLPAAALLVASASAQVLMGGGTYSQDFDSLAGSGSANDWTNNVTLPGWYASQSAAPHVVAIYRASTGSTTTGSLYSFGGSGSSDRALGSIASGTPGDFAYGVLFTNDTAMTMTRFRLSYTGEQWRDGGNTNLQKLAFSWRVSNTAISNSEAGNASLWTPFDVLDFRSPVAGATPGALDGNDPANRKVFTNVALPGVTVQPGQEIFFRWFDANDSGYDHGLAIDNLTVAWQTTNLPSAAPVFTLQPRSQAVGEGGVASFTVDATANPPPAYQWRFNGTNLPGETGATLELQGVTRGAAGVYSVLATNAIGATNSRVAVLTVMPASWSAPTGALRVLIYNVHGNGVADWRTNIAQARAIGRELAFLNPDIVAFNEIPTNGVSEMPDWMKAFLPGFYLATNAIGDGYIQSCIASRFPILHSASHLHASNLNTYGYDGKGFTRDLFEAEIRVPGWPLPLHVFVAHLKAGSAAMAQDDADKRAAEASAISNYLAAVFLAGTNGTHPYLLAGDMNEDALFPDTDYFSGHPIRRLTGAGTGLRFTTPVNSVTRRDDTESIQTRLDTRFDYILPCGALFSNIAGGEVFRTDVLHPLPAGLQTNDDRVASDHLPVLMVFNNPFATPFRLLSIGVTNRVVSLKWESTSNRTYSVEASPDLSAWTPLATNLVATGEMLSFNADAAETTEFFRIRRAP